MRLGCVFVADVGGQRLLLGFESLRQRDPDLNRTQLSQPVATARAITALDIS